MKIRFRLSAARLTAHTRDPGYLEEILEVGQVSGDFITLTMEQYRDIAQRYTPAMFQVGSGVVERKPFPFKREDIAEAAAQRRSPSVKGKCCAGTEDARKD